MANYEQSGNRWTMIMIRSKRDGKETLERATFDLVRFNADVDPEARQDIVPIGGSDKGKLFERIWVVDQQPYKGQYFGGQE